MAEKKARQNACGLFPTVRVLQYCPQVSSALWYSGKFLKVISHYLIGPYVHACKRMQCKTQPFHFHVKMVLFCSWFQKQCTCISCTSYIFWSYFTTHRVLNWYIAVLTVKYALCRRYFCHHSFCMLIVPLCINYAKLKVRNWQLQRVLEFFNFYRLFVPVIPKNTCSNLHLIDISGILISI